MYSSDKEPDLSKIVVRGIRDLVEFKRERARLQKLNRKRRRNGSDDSDSDYDIPLSRVKKTFNT